MSEENDHPEIPKPYVPGERLEPEVPPAGALEIPFARIAPTTWRAEPAAPPQLPPPLPPYAPPWPDPAVLQIQAQEAARRMRYRVWPVFTLWGLSIVVQLIAGAIVGLALVGIHGTSGADRIPDMLVRPHVFSLMILSIGIGLTASVLIAAGLSKVPTHLRLGLTRPRAGIFTLLVMLVGTLALAELVLDVLHLLPLPQGPDMFSQAIGGLTGLPLVIMVCVLGLTGPFAEELLVRGYMMVRLVERWGPLAAILITSALFGIMHLNIVQGVFTTFLGLALGYCAWRAQSIWPAVLGHMANNVLVTFRIACQPEWDDPKARAYWAIPVSMLIILLSVAWIEWRARRPNNQQPATNN